MWCNVNFEAVVYIFEKKIPMRNYGMDFWFSGNNGNIVGKALDTRYTLFLSQVVCL